MSKSNNVFPIFYLGNIEYYVELIKYESVVFEQWEHLPKQTYRARCEIQGPNGKLKLLQPIHRTGERPAVKELRFSTTEDWQKLHWKSLEAAYRSSPYFEYYERDFYPFYHSENSSLIEFNLALHQLILKLLGIEQPFSLTETYVKDIENDYRDSFSSKKDSENERLTSNTYIQVFNDRMPFLPNLSIVDLLFNEGPNALSYLKSILG